MPHYTRFKLKNKGWVFVVNTSDTKKVRNGFITKCRCRSCRRWKSPDEFTYEDERLSEHCTDCSPQPAMMQAHQNKRNYFRAFT